MSTIFMILITFLSIIGFILYPVIRWKWSFSIAPFFGVLTIISFLYIFGLFGFLLGGVVFVFLCSIAFTLISVYEMRKEFNRVFDQLFVPSFFIFLILFVLFGYFSRFWTLYSWDEFSHWGIFAKAMYFEDKFPAQVDFVIVWPHYPPGMTIFHYYITKLVGYSEKAVYFSQSVIILSAIMVLLKDIPWKKGLLSVGIILFGYWSLYFWGYKVNTIYQDGLLGVVFGAAFVTYSSNKKEDKDAIVKIIPALFVLPLIKELGIIFSLIVAGIVAFDRFMLSKNGVIKRNFQVLLRQLPILCIPFLSFLSWKIFLKLLKVSAPPRDLNLGDLLNAFSIGASDIQREAILRFLNSYKNFEIGYAPWAGLDIALVFFVLLFVYSIFRPESGYKRRLSFQALLLFGFLFYSSILFVFFVLFDPTLQSYSRYLGTYCIGWSYAVFGIFFDDAQSETNIKFQTNQKNIIAICVLFVLAVFIQTPLSSILAPPDRLWTRDNIHNKIEKLLPYMEEDSRVWVIWQNSNGFEFHIIRYLIAPRTSQDLLKWSVENLYSTSDEWTYNISPENLRKEIVDNNYSYVLVASAGSQFWEEYGGLFCNQYSGKDFHLFKVEIDCFRLITP